jgi:hypothetical protein
MAGEGDGGGGCGARNGYGGSQRRPRKRARDTWTLNRLLDAWLEGTYIQKHKDDVNEGRTHTHFALGSSGRPRRSRCRPPFQSTASTTTTDS